MLHHHEYNIEKIGFKKTKAKLSSWFEKKSVMKSLYIHYTIQRPWRTSFGFMVRVKIKVANLLVFVNSPYLWNETTPDIYWIGFIAGMFFFSSFLILFIGENPDVKVLKFRFYCTVSIDLLWNVKTSEQHSRYIQYIIYRSMLNEFTIYHCM